jgi:Helix-turn-helix domain
MANAKTKPSRKGKNSSTTRGKALAHPLRARIWIVLRERMASPVQLSRELGAPVTDCSYHCRRLKELGVAEIVDERPVRGSTEHFYRATDPHLVSEDEWEALGVMAQDGTLGAIVEAMFRDIDASYAARLLFNPKSILSRTPILLSAEGRDEAVEMFDRFAEELEDLVSRDTAARGETGEDGKPFASYLVLIERPPAPSST